MGSTVLSVVICFQNNIFDRLVTANLFYERMLDMRRTVRNKEQGGYTTKRFSIHNRFVMGAYYSIAYKLMYGLTEEVKNGIKEELLKEI